MKLLTPAFILFCFLATHVGLAQTDVNKDIDVAKVYEQVVKEGYGTPTVYLKLANEYYFQGKYDRAKKWYEKVFETEKPTDKMILFRYKQTLKALKLTFEGNPYLVTSVFEDN